MGPVLASLQNCDQIHKCKNDLQIDRNTDLKMLFLHTLFLNKVTTRFLPCFLNSFRVDVRIILHSTCICMYALFKGSYMALITLNLLWHMVSQLVHECPSCFSVVGDITKVHQFYFCVI